MESPWECIWAKKCTLLRPRKPKFHPFQADQLWLKDCKSKFWRCVPLKKFIIFSHFLTLLTLECFCMTTFLTFSDIQFFTRIYFSIFHVFQEKPTATGQKFDGNDCNYTVMKSEEFAKNCDMMFLFKMPKTTRAKVINWISIVYFNKRKTQIFIVIYW